MPEDVSEIEDEDEDEDKYKAEVVDEADCILQ